MLAPSEAGLSGCPNAIQAAFTTVLRGHHLAQGDGQRIQNKRYRRAIRHGVAGSACLPRPIFHGHDRVHDRAKAQSLPGNRVPRVQPHTRRRCFPHRVVIRGHRGPRDEVGERAAATLGVGGGDIDAALCAALHVSRHGLGRSARLVERPYPVLGTRPFQLFFFVRGNRVPICVEASWKQTELGMRSVKG